MARARGVREEEVAPADLTTFKAVVARTLGPHSSALLLDPEYSLPVIDEARSLTGLLLAYEQSGYDNTRPGRRPSLLPFWSVRRLVEAGAQGIKVLLHYTPDESEEYNREKGAFVERVGAECAAADVPFFLELISYAPEGSLPPDPRGKPEIVRRSIEEFGQDRYGVDVLKVEVPVDIRRVAGAEPFRGEALWTRAQACDAFQHAFGTAKKPLIFLSAGVTEREFAAALTIASESGIRWCGFLCGRAVWQDGIPILVNQGTEALEEWMRTEGRQRLAEAERALKGATPWWTPETTSATV